MFIFPGGATVAVDPVEVSLTANTTSTANLTTYTFSSQAFGTAASNRKIVVCTCHDNNDTVSSVTMGGVSGTKATGQIAGSELQTEIWYAAVTTGTSGDVVVTLTGGAGQMGIGVYRVIGAATSPSATGGSTGEGTTQNDDINVLAGGILIGVSGNRSAATCTWTNLTETYDEAIETYGLKQSGAAAAFSSAQTPITITALLSSTSVDECFSLAAWGLA